MTTTLLMLFLAAAQAVPQSPGALAERQEHVFEGTVRRAVKMPYLLYFPKGYGEVEKKWPLLLYLHGGMGRGDNLERLAIYPVPRMLERGTHEVPFIVLVPQCPKDELWTDTEALVALLDEVTAAHSVDPERVYLTGYSIGGNGAWFLAYKHPERFAAVAPMSGPGSTWWAARLKDLPIWVFHGAGDELVPAREAQEMVAALEAEGAEVKFSLHPTRGHSPPSVEEHLELFTWLLQHRKAPP